MRTRTYPEEARVSGLQRFEHRLEQLISGAFARAFRSAVQPVEIAAALHRELDNNAQILSRQRRMVPNDFHVELSQPDLSRLAPYDTALASELRGQVEDYAQEQGYVFPGKVSVSFHEADDLTTGRFRVTSRAQASVSGNSFTETQAGRAKAYLEVNGTRHPLTGGSLVIGRGTEADLRINDPGVSRRHVEFRIVAGPRGPEVTVHDLGSTNGMLVDGQKTTSAVLENGAQVKVGSTTVTLHLVEESA
jgi:hypothetical protein